VCRRTEAPAAPRSRERGASLGVAEDARGRVKRRGP
jgi:hypothetical protein